MKLDVIYVSGPGHGGPAVVGNTYLEGTSRVTMGTMGTSAMSCQYVATLLDGSAGAVQHWTGEVERYSVFREQWRLEEQCRLTEKENDRLRTELADVTQERDQIKAQFLALHR